MTDVTLGDFTFQEGDADDVTEDISSNIENLPMPLAGPSETLLFDFEGVVKMITITGNLTDATSTRVSGQSVLTIEEQKAYLQGLVNGLQSATSFTSTFNTSGVTVMVMSMNFVEKSGEPNWLRFTIKLVQGSG